MVVMCQCSCPGFDGYVVWLHSRMSFVGNKLHPEVFKSDGASFQQLTLKRSKERFLTVYSQLSHKFEIVSKIF